ncbi:Fur family transcriptional regulator [Georgenia faecalis]|uniref:Fur family transcriptional regulator n=1 Tax=Georgenia faecalis TaxID=2483799 RepID=A0ABV9D886_9MICO|nr:Fur family transcriptional regulator [Georgenia faecalis]
MPTAVDHLRAAGLRVTAQRGAVLDVLSEASGDHLTAAAVAGLVRERLGDVSTQAIYDCLDALTRAGLASRIEPAGQPARFEARVGDNHHHLVCRSCGVVRDVDCAVGAAPCLSPAEDHGFTLETAEITYWGLCPRCAAEEQYPTTGRTVL